MKEIKLTHGFVALVDDEDFEMLMQYKWHCTNRLRGGRARASKNGTTVSMHRLLMNAPEGFDVDHKNGNPLDNRKSNLRICTRRQNNKNKRMSKVNKSGFMGVHYTEVKKKWRARIEDDEKDYHLGYYNTPLAAALAYDGAARELHGEFACTNAMLGLIPADTKFLSPHEDCGELVDKGKISDGYHTFDELYEHRCLLFMALMKCNPKISWRANNHDDGSSCANWFVAGMNLPTGDITYHLPSYVWEMLDNIGIATSNKAPKWDGHTSQDVVNRLELWIKQLTNIKPQTNKE